MSAKRTFSDAILQSMFEDFYSDIPGQQLAAKYGCGYFPTLRNLWIAKYGKEALKDRFKRLCALSKSGNKNPQFGKFKHKHCRYKEVHITTQGYRSVEAPRWYAGSTDKNGKALEHILVACEHARLRKLPPGCIVHHKDENKRNNHFSNLEIMLRGKHMVVHRWIKYRKKVQRLSRKGVEPKKARSTPSP